MRTFHDNRNRTWEISVTVAAVKRVRALCGIDLCSLVETDGAGKPDTSVLQRLADDPVLLVDCIYAVCKPEADRGGISDEQFGEAMAGDAISAATDALLEEIVDFFPETKRRILQKVLQASRRFEEAMEQRAKRAMADGTLDREIDSGVDRLIASYGSAQGISE